MTEKAVVRSFWRWLRWLADVFASVHNVIGALYFYLDVTNVAACREEEQVQLVQSQAPAKGALRPHDRMAG